jgi:hypothetical protein
VGRAPQHGRRGVDGRRRADDPREAKHRQHLVGEVDGELAPVLGREHRVCREELVLELVLEQHGDHLLPEHLGAREACR